MKYNMTTGKEWKLILFFTIPLLIGNILQQMYHVADGIIVGNIVGETALAAVTTCQPLTLIYLALAFGLSLGAGVTTSQYFGAGKKDELPVVIDTALILIGACGVFFTLIAVFLSPMILESILNVPANILPEAITYMRIISMGLFFQFMYNCIASMLRGFGDSKATLYFLIISSVLNVTLSLLFVVFMQWGVAGAAFGTVIAQGVSVIASYIYLRKFHPAVNKSKHWEAKYAITIIKLGLPIAIQMSIISFGNGAMQRLVNSYGVTTPSVVPAYGAATRLDTIVFAPITSFQTGLANFTGQNLGAGKLNRVKRGMRSSMFMSVSITLTISIVYYVFAENVVGLFGLTDDSLIIGSQIIRYFTMFFWILGCNLMFSGVLQGAGDTVIISIASLTSITVRVIAGYLTSYLGILEYSAAWIPVPFGWICWAIIVYSRYFSGKWKNKALVGRLSQNEKGDLANE